MPRVEQLGARDALSPGSGVAGGVAASSAPVCPPSAALPFVTGEVSILMTQPAVQLGGGGGGPSPALPQH